MGKWREFRNLNIRELQGESSQKMSDRKRWTKRAGQRQVEGNKQTDKKESRADKMLHEGAQPRPQS